MVAAGSKAANPPTECVRQADELRNANQVEQAIATYNSLLSENSQREEALREKEYALVRLGEIYRDLKYAHGLRTTRDGPRWG